MVRLIPESSIKYLGRRLVFNPLKSGLRNEPDSTLRPMRGEFNLGEDVASLVFWAEQWQEIEQVYARTLLVRISELFWQKNEQMYALLSLNGENSSRCMLICLPKPDSAYMCSIFCQKPLYFSSKPRYARFPSQGSRKPIHKNNREIKNPTRRTKAALLGRPSVRL